MQTTCSMRSTTGRHRAAMMAVMQGHGCGVVGARCGVGAFWCTTLVVVVPPWWGSGNAVAAAPGCPMGCPASGSGARRGFRCRPARPGGGETPRRPPRRRSGPHPPQPTAQPKRRCRAPRCTTWCSPSRGNVAPSGLVVRAVRGTCEGWCRLMRAVALSSRLGVPLPGPSTPLDASSWLDGAPQGGRIVRGPPGSCSACAGPARRKRGEGGHPPSGR